LALRFAGHGVANKGVATSDWGCIVVWLVRTWMRKTMITTLKYLLMQCRMPLRMT
jgi:hypothetical protein